MNATQGGGVRTGQVAREMRCSSRRDTRVMRHSADRAALVSPAPAVSAPTAAPPAAVLVSTDLQAGVAAGVAGILKL